MVIFGRIRSPIVTLTGRLYCPVVKLQLDSKPLEGFYFLYFSPVAAEAAGRGRSRRGVIMVFSHLPKGLVPFGLEKFPGGGGFCPSLRMDKEKKNELNLEELYIHLFIQELFLQ
jgi:hypothetical protein